jgi:murein DD-endopeptidase MepM/ murein hydrolase activator NlpD
MTARTAFLRFISAGISAMLALGPFMPVSAGEVDQLNDEIRRRQNRVSEISSLIDSYRQKISEQQTQTESLEGQIVILENRVKEKELSVERAKLEIESLNLEIQVLGSEIDIQGERIEKQKDFIAYLVREINAQDQVTTFDVLLTQDSLSGFFSELEEIQKLERDLGTTLDRVKEVKTVLEQKRLDREKKQDAVAQEQRTLKRETLALQAEKNYKESLISETKEREDEFRSIVYQLRQQQENASGLIADLERKLAERLRSADEALARGDVLLDWPVDPSRGITAIFHDPTYPFRHLFEHPGTDIRAGVGTPVTAAAGGYVAWNKLGRMYGNYTMIVHPGGIATVYAHLSEFIAEADTYVDRGDTIALSGGMPGAKGAGFSSGPHLHFEVREDGVPVDAEPFLPQVPNSYYDYYDEYKDLGIRL